MCEKCNTSRIRALQGIAVALAAQTKDTENENAGALGQELALVVAGSLAEVKFEESGEITDEALEVAEETASTLGKALMDNYASSVLSELEFSAGFLIEGLEVIQKSARKALLLRYKDGDRSMAPVHKHLAEQVSSLSEGLLEMLGGEGSVLVMNTGKKVPRDDSGNPIMAPVADVS